MARRKSSSWISVSRASAGWRFQTDTPSGVVEGWRPTQRWANQAAGRVVRTERVKRHGKHTITDEAGEVDQHDTAG